MNPLDINSARDRWISDDEERDDQGPYRRRRRRRGSSASSSDLGDSEADIKRFGKNRDKAVLWFCGKDGPTQAAVCLLDGKCQTGNLVSTEFIHKIRKQDDMVNCVLYSAHTTCGPVRLIGKEILLELSAHAPPPRNEAMALDRGNATKFLVFEKISNPGLGYDVLLGFDWIFHHIFSPKPTPGKALFTSKLPKRGFEMMFPLLNWH